MYPVISSQVRVVQTNQSLIEQRLLIGRCLKLVAPVIWPALIQAENHKYFYDISENWKQQPLQPPIESDMEEHSKYFLSNSRRLRIKVVF